MKIRMRLLAAALAAATLPAWRIAVAEDAGQPGQAEPADAGLAAKGKALYGEHCLHCHGLNMVNPGTVAYDLRQFPHNDTARFVRSVSEGKNGRMPRWGDLLKPEEIDEIWAYVKTGGAD